jgi:glycosyltransferase involved in cell wall biosynthesis
MYNSNFENKYSILHFCSYTWETGGPPNVIYNHSRFLIEKDWTVHIASSLAQSNNIYSSILGMKIFLFKKSYISTFFKDFSISMLLWFVKNRNNYSVINVHGLWNLGSILPFYLKNNAIKIITVHGFLDTYVMGNSKFLKRIFWNFIQKKCFEKADLIHAISKSEHQHLLKIFPEYVNKIVLIPNGLYAPNSYEDIDHKFKSIIDNFIEKEDFVFLFLSRISKKKGLDILVPAFNKLLNDFPKIKLIIAGPKGNFSDELNNIIFNNSNIILLPSCIEWSKDYLFKKSDVFVLPSYSEGFSIAALEAISYGKPSIFSHFVGFSDDISKFKAGLICETTIISLYDQMKEIFASTELRKELTLNSQRLFTTNFRMDYIGQLFLNRINHLLHEQ